MMRSRLILIAAMVILPLAYASTARATDYDWVGGGANDYWMTDANWDPATPAPNYTTDSFTISSGTAEANGGTFAAPLLVDQTGILSVTTTDARPTQLTLNGGTLAAGNTSNYSLVQSGTLTIDPGVGPVLDVAVIDNSTIRDFYLRLKLDKDAVNGTGDISKTGTGRLRLGGTAVGGTWDGTLNIDGGSVYIENINALAQGTIEVDADELELGTGFNSGSVYVRSGGVARVTAGNTYANDLHLDGGKLQSVGDAYFYANSNANLHVDSDSQVQDDETQGQWLYLPQLHGSGGLQVVGTGRVGLWNNENTATYTGTITVDSGATLRLAHTAGLSGGTIDIDAASGTVQMGTGIGGTAGGTINLNPGGVLTMDSNDAYANDADPAKGLRLNGGTIVTTNGYFTNNSNAKLNLETGTQSYADSNGRTTLRLPQLSGAGDLEILGTGGGYVRLWGNVNNSNYTGTITVDGGGELRIEHISALSGGTIDIGTGSGTVYMGPGFGGTGGGRINLTTGGVLVMNSTDAYAYDADPAKGLRLSGGTIVGGGGYFTNNSNAKMILETGTLSYADSNGLTNLYLPQFSGDGDLQILGTGGGYVRLRSNVNSTDFTGTITIDSGGTLQMDHEYGLSGGTLELATGSGTFNLSSGFSLGQVNVLTGGVVNVNNTSNAPADNLHLQGGTLLGMTNNVRVGDNGGSRIYVDSDGILETAAAISANNYMYIFAALYGSGDLSVVNNTAGARIGLGYNGLVDTYSGTITLDTGDTLRMYNANGLCGGNIDVETGGTFQLGSGFNNGAVNVKTGGEAQADNTGTQRLYALHLQGGTVRPAGNSNYWIGENNTNSKIYVDSESTFETTYAGKYLYIGAQLQGTGSIVKTGPGILGLWNGSSSNNSGTYFGDWDIQEGTLYINYVGSRLGESLGSGTNVNIAAGAVVDFHVDNSNQPWNVTKTFAGEGSVLFNVHDGLTIHRDAADAIGGISPGTGDGDAGILTFNLGTNNATPFTYSTLNFAQDGTGGVQWHIDVAGTGGVAGTDYDQIVLTSGSYPYAWLNGLNNVNLVVDIGAIGGDPGTMTIFTGADNDLSSMSFGSQTWLNNYFGDVIYGADGTIKLTNIAAPVLWEAASGDWSEGTKWSPDGSPDVTTLTSVNNGGSCTVTGDESTKTLFVQYAGSTVTIDSGGSLTVDVNMEVQSGATLTVAGGLTTPILNSSGTTSLDSGSGAITDLKVLGGTTSVNGWAGTVTNLTVSDGAFSVANGADFSAATTAVGGGTVDFGTGSSSDLGTMDVYAGTITANRALAIDTLTMTGGTLVLNDGVSITNDSTARNADVTLTGSASTMASLTVGKTDNDVAASLTVQDTSVTATTIDVRTDAKVGYVSSGTAPTLTIDGSTVDVGTLRVGAGQNYGARGTITDSTVNVSTNLYTQGNSTGDSSVLTVGAGGVLNLQTDSSAWGHSTANGYLELVDGGVFSISGSVELDRVRNGTNSGTAWDGGIVRVGGQLINFNGQQLDAGNILDMSTTGSFGGTVGTDVMHLRGGTIMFGAGYARDTRLQMTEDLGTIVVAGGALTGMPGTVAASVTLDGAAATWTTGTTTMGSGTTLTVNDGASATIGAGNVLNVDQMVFTGTGGAVNMTAAILVHAANQLVLDNGTIAGSGTIVIGSEGLDLGTGASGGTIDGTGAGFALYGDVSGEGTMNNVTVYGNVTVGHSPGLMQLGNVTLTSSTVLAMELAGSGTGEYDQIALTGDLTLQSGVLLDIVWLDGYEAVSGESFQLFDLGASSIDGEFALVLPEFSNPELGWDTSALYTSGTISVTGGSEIPEPATVALLAIGAMGVLVRRKRRQ